MVSEFDRGFEEARHQHLHAVAVEPDQLAQEGDRQEVLPFLVLLLEDDLGQHAPRNVIAGLGVVHREVVALLDHQGEVFERHVGAGAGIVEPSICVLLDDDRFVGLRHGPAAVIGLAHPGSRGLAPSGTVAGGLPKDAIRPASQFPPPLSPHRALRWTRLS